MTTPRPPVTTVVHLVRHGEVDNPEGVLYGRLPGYVLSARGHLMATSVATYLGRRDITLVVSSPLERARQTAASVAAAHDLEVLVDERVIEAGNHFQGQRFGRGRAAVWHPATWALLANPLRPSWGEPYQRIATRMLAAIAGARDHAAGHEAVIVSHQLPVWTVRRKLEGRRLWHDPRSRQCSLASLTSLTYHGDELESIGYREPAAALLLGASTVAGA
ncbi:MAG TPA: histidine phosphatase family protein [Dermatophilaceae bacterium]|nr:histidine phosphatase family protein [Dermatophilaceae bacterium]